MPAAIASMTGFARTEGVSAGLAWVWELRSVNGRSLDLRFRLPNGWDSLEPAWRDLASKTLKRGNVSANLTIKRQTEARLELDPQALEQVMAIVHDLHRRLPGSPPPAAERLLSLPGVLRQAQADQQAEVAAAAADVKAGFIVALDALTESRQAEGARLAAILNALLEEITTLRDTAAAQAADQPAAHRARMLETVEALLGSAPKLPEERIAQEVALLAGKSDVREELDRLTSHIAAARDLLAEAANIGRKLDFLTQEFNREVNTLCSKSASTALTATGLKLKAAVEQVREQVQNIE
ncbi:MAG: YicC family protein [Proteobacteria bacterium]|nr:YicC family protein [Pseudomonadota bacterium]